MRYVDIYHGKVRYTHTRWVLQPVGSAGLGWTLGSPDYQHLWMAGSVTQTWQTELKRKEKDM